MRDGASQMICCNFTKSRGAEDIVKAFTKLRDLNPNWKVFDHRETDEYVSKKLLTVDGRLVGYTGERELHDRFQISSQGVLVIGIVKKSSGFAIKYETVGLPLVESIATLEKSLDIAIKEILRDIARFKDAEAFITHVERKACDICLHEIGKEPKVVVIVQ